MTSNLKRYRKKKQLLFEENPETQVKKKTERMSERE